MLKSYPILKISNKEDYNLAASAEFRGESEAAGLRSLAANSGQYSKTFSNGDYSLSANVGFKSETVSSGLRSGAVNLGAFSSATVNGRESVACVIGFNSKAKGIKTCWLVLTERNTDHSIKSIKAFEVDGINIKENTFYSLVNGEPMALAD
jgi:hypothetical protein